MLDPRVTKLAKLLCTHSTKLGKDDRVLIHAFDIPEEAVAELVRVAQSTGAQTVVRIEHNLIKRQLLHGMTKENAETIAKVELAEMKEMTAYIALRGTHNYAEQADVPADIQQTWQLAYRAC